MSEEKLLEPLTFNSIIYLSTESNMNNFVFSNGFVDNYLSLKPISTITNSKTPLNDFSFCLFVILPFPNLQSFESQAKAIQQWK